MQRNAEQYKKRLEILKKDYQENMNVSRDNLQTSLKESIGELSTYDNHPADIGDEGFERGKDLGFVMLWQDQIHKIDDALEKINLGTYGICDECGKEIARERLNAIPFTTKCLECKEDFEDMERHLRPIEEDVVSPPFGGMNHDTSLRQVGDADSLNGFDGEDAWQSVARFGSSDSPQDIGEDITDYTNAYIDHEEDQGAADDVDSIAVYRDKDGMLYQNFAPIDDESEPEKAFKS